MSGGFFDYTQYNIDRIAADVDQLIRNNNSKELNEYQETVGRNYSPKVIKELKKGLSILKKAAIYAQRIDWLASGDDGEESFLERLKEDLDAMK